MTYQYPWAGKAREGRGPGVPTVAGTPSAGTDEVQTLTVTGTPTGGSFKLQFMASRTAAIAYNAAASAVQTALRALSPIGSSGVTCGGGPLPGTPVTITFAGPLARKDVPLVSVVESALTGGSSPAAAVAVTTPGVTASYKGAPVGAQIVDSTTGKHFSNTGTADAPTWTVIGTQT